MIHFIDTSVLLNLLNVPLKNQNHDTVKEEYNKFVAQNDNFVFPAAVLFETGNHISHISDGSLRRTIASKFVRLINQAVDLQDNMSVIPEITKNELNAILENFPDQAMRGIGFGDSSIVAQFEDYWENKQPIGEMRIWSLDAHLASHSHIGGLSRRKNR